MENAVVKEIKGALTWKSMLAFAVLLLTAGLAVLAVLDAFGVASWLLQPVTTYKIWAARKKAAASAG